MANFHPKIKSNPGIDINDILITPQYSTVESRSTIDLSTCISVNNEAKIKNLTLKYPFITANMDTITGIEMAKAVLSFGAGAILHRHVTPKEMLKWIKTLSLQNLHPIIPSIGVKDIDYFSAINYISEGADAICIDVAHGHHVHVERMIKKIRSHSPDAHVIVGNIGTLYAAIDLKHWGATAVKVGIGNGFVCTTRTQTGVGAPHLNAVANISEYSMYENIPVIADGGVRSSGDIAKMLAVGAHAIMSGYLFAGTDECPKNSIGDSVTTAIYRGMASANAKAHNKAPLKNIEGISTSIDKKGPVNKILEGLVDGVQSSFSYSNSRNIKEFHERVKLIITK